MNRFIARTGGLVFTVALALAVATWWSFPSAARWLDVGEPPRRVDYVMCLGGDAERRPFVIAELVKAGLARTALVTQARPGPDVEDGIVPPSHEITRRVLLARGVPQERIVMLPGSSAHTADESEVLLQFLKKHPQASVAIVTSACHTRRSRWTFERRLAAFPGQLSFVSAPNPDFSTDRWWRTEAGFRAVTSEYLKLCAYWFLYGNGVLCSALVTIVGLALLVAPPDRLVRWYRSAARVARKARVGPAEQRCAV